MYTCIKFQILGSRALYQRFETCLEYIVWQVCFFLRHKHKLLILSSLSDFMTCSSHFNIKSNGSISQLWNTLGQFSVQQKLIYTHCERLSDFVMGRKRFYILSRVCISASKHCRKMKFRTYVHLTLVSKI